MTLVIAIPTKEPLVFTVDTRLTIGQNKYDDTADKLVPIGDIAIASAFGAVRHLAGSPPQVRFDLYAIMREFFANGDFDAKRVGEFNQHVLEQFANFRAKYRDNEPIKTAFQGIFYAWRDDAFRFNHAKFWTKEDGALSWTGTSKECTHGGIHAHGDIALIDELIAGHNPDFDDLRGDKQIQRFVIHRQSQVVNDVDPDEAIALSRRIMELSHERYRLLRDDKDPISRQCRIALLRRGGGCEVIQ